jgi:hypothetical protein
VKKNLSGGDAALKSYDALTADTDGAAGDTGGAGNAQGPNT